MQLSRTWHDMRQSCRGYRRVLRVAALTAIIMVTLRIDKNNLKAIQESRRMLQIWVLNNTLDQNQRNVRSCPNVANAVSLENWVSQGSKGNQVDISLVIDQTSRAVQAQRGNHAPTRCYTDSYCRFLCWHLTCVGRVPYCSIQNLESLYFRKEPLRTQRISKIDRMGLRVKTSYSTKDKYRVERTFYQHNPDNLSTASRPRP